MQFALVDNKRTAASRGLTGFCPGCGGLVIPKCGSQRIHHWAHRGGTSCDACREPETPWHRAWKSKFPEDWREIVRQGPLDGKKHIADVHTAHGLAIEFQRSHLPPEKRTTREVFHGNMFWVVDGSRLKRDAPRFLEGILSFTRIGKGLYVTAAPEKVFPRSWLSCEAPVFFDFSNAQGIAEDRSHVKQLLWCLLPSLIDGYAVILCVSKETFLHWARAPAQPSHTHAILARVAPDLKEWLWRRRRAAEQASAWQQPWRCQALRRRLPRF